MAIPKTNRIKYIFTELAHHLPFSIFGVTTGLITVGFLNFFAILANNEAGFIHGSDELFHVFHPAHVLISAVATTAMFWKHEKRRLKAILVGFFGTLMICGISDIIFPFVGGIIFGFEMHFHLCAIEEPMLVFPFAIIGVLAGLMVGNSFEKSTEYSHSVHVFISSVASILYLTSYGLTDFGHVIGQVFLVTIIAVMIPCCASDIAFPLVCVHRNCNHD